MSHASGRVEIATNSGHNRASLLAIPNQYDAHLRRFSPRPFRHLRSAPRFARGNTGVCRRIRSAADASRRRGRFAIDAQGPFRFRLASVLADDADDVRWLYRPHRVAGLARHRDVQMRDTQRRKAGTVRDDLADHRRAASRTRFGAGWLMQFFEDIEAGQWRALASFALPAELI